jgi:serine/threonine protein kinase
MVDLESSASIGAYSLNYELGGDSFSTVWLAEHTELHLQTAIKIIPKSAVLPNSAQTRFIREIHLLNQMDHPFIVKTFEIFDDDIRHYLVMEFADHGSLYDYVQANGALSESQALRYFVQLISALDYLHNVSCVPHRNLKPENVMLDRFNNIRLIDFGLAGNVRGPEAAKEIGPSSSPEVAAGKRYVYSSDIWSAGIILYFMLTAQYPFTGEDREELCRNITEGQLVFEGSFSPPLIDLLRKLLHKQREERITIPKIMEHPWFSLAMFKTMPAFGPADTLDMEIVRQLAKVGYDAKLLPDMIARDRHSQQGILYEILKRHSLTESINASVTGAAEAPAQGGGRFSLAESQTARLAGTRPQLRIQTRVPPPVPHPAMPGAHAVHAVASVALSLAKPGVRGVVNSPRGGAPRPRPVRATASSRGFAT